MLRSAIRSLTVTKTGSLAIARLAGYHAPGNDRVKTRTVGVGRQPCLASYVSLTNLKPGPFTGLFSKVCTARPVYENFITCGLTCHERLCKEGGNPTMCDVSAVLLSASIVCEHSSFPTCVNESTVIGDQELRAEVLVAMPAGNLRGWHVWCVSVALKTQRSRIFAARRVGVLRKVHSASFKYQEAIAPMRWVGAIGPHVIPLPVSDHHLVTGLFRDTWRANNAAPPTPARMWLCVGKSESTIRYKEYRWVFRRLSILLSSP